MNDWRHELHHLMQEGCWRPYRRNATDAAMQRWSDGRGGIAICPPLLGLAYHIISQVSNAYTVWCLCLPLGASNLFSSLDYLLCVTHLCALLRSAAQVNNPLVVQRQLIQRVDEFGAK